jgi:hypothetical protein
MALREAHLFQKILAYLCYLDVLNGHPKTEVFTGIFPWGKVFFEPLKKQIRANVGGLWVHLHLWFWHNPSVNSVFCFTPFIITAGGINVLSTLQHSIMNTLSPFHLKLIHLSLPLVPLSFLVCCLNVNNFQRRQSRVQFIICSLHTPSPDGSK